MKKYIKPATEAWEKWSGNANLLSLSIGTEDNSNTSVGRPGDPDKPGIGASGQAKPFNVWEEYLEEDAEKYDRF